MFQCGFYNEAGECVIHRAVRRGEHNGISVLTNKRVKPGKDSAACHHLLYCNYSPTFEDFSVLCREKNKYLFRTEREKKKYLFRTERKPSYNER